MKNNNGTRGFRKISIVTIVAVYLLILAGGIVRSTGSGMGCPDWPKCFGRLIPPTNESQLPVDYKEKYQVQGHVAEFNVTKTWIEYVNRLLGAIIGVLIFLVLVYSIPFLKRDKPIFYLSLLTFLLVGFEGWLGKVVVATNLSPLMITLHMAVALIIVALLIYIISRSRKEELAKEEIVYKKEGSISLIILGLFAFIQILTGTQVREEIDIISTTLNYTQRETWIGSLGEVFDLHRLFAWSVLILNAVFLYRLNKSVRGRSIIMKSGVLVFILIVVEMLLGIAMGLWSIPAFIQPLHLLFATLIFGLQFFMFTVLSFSNNLSFSGDK